MSTNRIRLELPSPAHKRAAADFVQEHVNAGEKVIQGGSLLEEMASYEEWLEHLALCRAGKWPGWVASTTFFGMAGERLVGVIDIRHTLNAYQLSYGGHIGYGVRPSERRKGYATAMLALALEFCRSLGLTRVMVSCDVSNEASKRTILAHGGELEREAIHPDGTPIQIYWIALPS